MRLGTAVMTLLSVLLVACHAPGPVPPELVDVWRSDAPAYRDRIFEVREGWVVFGTGEHTRSIFEIEGVDSEPGSGGRVHHTLHYWTQDGERLSVQLIYQPGDPGRSASKRPDSLRIGHRDETWVRQRDARWLEEG